MLASLLMFWVDVAWMMLPAASCIISTFLLEKHIYIYIKYICFYKGLDFGTFPWSFVQKAPISGHTGYFFVVRGPNVSDAIIKGWERIITKRRPEDFNTTESQSRKLSVDLGKKERTDSNTAFQLKSWVQRWWRYSTGMISLFLYIYIYIYIWQDSNKVPIK